MAMVDLLLALISVPVLFATAYLAVLTLLSAALKVPPTPASGALKFRLLVPAHNESAVIQRTVKSLLALQWPEAQRRITVIADNCEDDTASLAAAAGAEVWARQDAVLRGKGFALEFGYNRVLAEQWADAVVVIDADTEVTPNLLAAFSARLAGADGGAIQALQAYSGVLNPGINWRTRLVTIAMTLMHRLRSRGRERLGVSSGLRGNGLCLRCEVLRTVPYSSFSIVEDLEYSITLGRAGVIVHYVDEAEVLAEMVSSAKAAESQRGRWENGRAQIRREQAWPLLRQALVRRDGVLLDLAIDLIVPPIATLGVAAVALLAVALLLRVFGLASIWGLLLPVVSLAFLALYTLRGIGLSGLGWRGWRDLVFLPFFVFWKLSLLLRRRAPAGWVRTQREQHQDDRGAGS
jgi:cellulose synthase/poly-beta-1,6-N-acetylglucosamine synthase-like glycosyltransferase